MQFNFWWFTSDPSTNIIIATIIWFIICSVCQRSCGKDQTIHPAAYIGYGVASFGMAFTSVFGIYGITFGAPFVFIGILLVVVIGWMSKSYTPSRHGEGVAAIQAIPRLAPDIDSSTTTCPSCGNEVSMLGGTVKPDGSIICPNCYKRFAP
ncbi:MAG: hypothetical protein EAX87_10950 [Candidatus Thorarchaeota archaeon]|nr:hypothetical protein [Candidatus Thorarchaeota archaeon]